MSLPLDIETMLYRISGGAVVLAAQDFDRIVRGMIREEIASAKAEERARRDQMLADIRAGNPVDAFVNRGDMPS